MMRKLFMVMLILFATKLTAQDPEFSQYYSAPLYLNPAFSGTGADHRLGLNYRNQWPAVPNGFVTYAASWDKNLVDLNSGLGVLIINDKAGSANLRNTAIHAQYSYKVHINDKWVISSGLNFGYGFRSIDFSKLVFGDQLAFDNSGTTPTEDPIFSQLNSTSYFDFGAGFLMYSRKFWFGFSGMHLNRPNRSMLDEDAIIPIKTSFHGGVRLPLYNGIFKKERVAALAPSFVYKKQGRFDQLDLGAYLLYDPVVFGIWYRGIPIQQNVLDNVSHDALVIILGFNFDNFQISYSYDVTVSEFGPISGGAHELALRYSIDVVRSTKKKKERYIPCPTFIKH